MYLHHLEGNNLNHCKQKTFQVHIGYLYLFHSEELPFLAQHLPIPMTFEVQSPVS
jgi:hypothetical protein